MRVVHRKVPYVAYGTIIPYQPLLLSASSHTKLYYYCCLQVDLLRDVYEVAARYYPLQPSKDVSFDLGRICMGLQRYPQAIAFFDASQRQCGEHHVSC